MLENFENILEYIIAIGPSIAAILSIIASVLIAIRKFGNLSDDSVKKINKLAEELRSDNETQKEDNKETKKLLRAVLKENAALQKELSTINKANAKVREIDTGDKNE